MGGGGSLLVATEGAGGGGGAAGCGDGGPWTAAAETGWLAGSLGAPLVWLGAWVVWAVPTDGVVTLTGLGRGWSLVGTTTLGHGRCCAAPYARCLHPGKGLLMQRLCIALSVRLSPHITLVAAP